MREIKIKAAVVVMLALLANCSSGSDTGTPSGSSGSTSVVFAPVITRTLFEKTFDSSAALSEWTDHSSGFSYDSNGYITATGGHATADKFLEFPTFLTAIDRIHFSLRMKILETPTSSSFGFGFGLPGIVAGREWITQTSFLDYPSAGFSPGLPVIFYQKGDGSGSDSTTLTQLATGTALPASVALNDVVRMDSTLNRDTWTVQITNETQNVSGTPVSYSGSFAPPPIPTSGLRAAAYVMPFTSRVRVYNFGGANAVLSFKADTTVSTSVDVALVGDSIFGGYYSGSLANTIQAQLEASSPNLKIQYFGGGGSTVPSLQLTAAQMKSSLSAASKVLIHCGGNDILGGGYTLQQIVDNMAALKTDLESTGADVYVLGPVPISSTYTTQMSTLQAMYVARFGSKYIDVFTPLATGTDINPVYFTVPGESSPIDGVHPISTGHAIIANIIKAKFPALFPH